MPEYISKYFVCSDFSYDVAQLKDAFAEVLGYEVAGQGGREASLHAADGFEGADKGFVVADVGDNDICLVDVG